MQIADIHNLTTKLIDEDWFIEFPEDGSHQEAEEFADVLTEMHQKADEDTDALYCFFEFATNEKGNADYDWDSREFLTRFKEAFRGADRNVTELLKRYYSDYSDAVLEPITTDRHIADYFDWEEYTKNQRPDLTLMQRGYTSYLFEEE